MQRKRKPLSQLHLQTSGDKRQRNGETSTSHSARAGRVLGMVLKNFMCHSHLEVTFDSNINFVIGQNGSGKSAILTALVVGLGGKASLTNRGNSIKGFIKTGKNGGSVEITLCNEGPLAYKHSVFGDKITVVRNFSASGSSSYKIKSSSGVTVSTQSKEIQRLCSTYNIQIDNPVCILNQDTSRNFLNTKDPRQKFILFMRATQLETLKNEYDKVFNNKIDTTLMLREKEGLYSDLKNTLKELKKKIENHRSIVKLKERVTLLQEEILWAKVRDAEVDVEKVQEELNQLETECSELQERISNHTRDYRAIEELIVNMVQSMGDLQRSIMEQNESQNVLVRALGTLKEDIHEKVREKRIILKDIAVKTGNCNIIEQEVKNITENFAKIEQEKLARLKEINNLKDKLKSIESLLETSRNDQFQLRNSLSRLKEEERNMMSESEQIQGQIDSTTSKLNSLKNDSHNSLSLYGHNMPEVINAIQVNKHKFTQLPRGPLGSYITLKDKRWAVAVEGFLSPGLLRAFAVDNIKDNEELMKIFQSVWKTRSGKKPMIITSKFFFQVHNVSSNLVDPIDGCMSIYSALNVSDPVVLNCLIDQTGIESVLLIPNTNEAIELMSEENRVPRNCKQAITMTGDKYYPDPNYKTYSSRYHNTQFLQVNRDDIIRQLEEKLTELSNKKQNAEDQYKTLKADIQEQTKNTKAMEVKVEKFNCALLHTTRLLADLQNTVEPDVANVNTLENELTELKRVIEEKKLLCEQVTTNVNEVKQKIKEKEDQLENIKTVIRGYEDRIESYQRQIREQQEKLNDFNNYKHLNTKRIVECKKKMNICRGNLLEKQNYATQRLQEASISGERPNSIREITSIVTELNSNQRTIRQVESDMENPEETLKKYQEINEKYKQATELMLNICEDVKQLQIAAEKCSNYYDHTEDYFITFVKHSFQKVLEFRQFKGSIDIDMENKKLDLIVIPQQGSQGITTTSNLSGGERSFSTVAFLYALWHCMEFPFYILDEFDVFMDKVNRTKVMEILLYHARSNPDLQFIFLTPQDVSFLNDKNVAIHRLEDPKREISGE